MDAVLSQKNPRVAKKTTRFLHVENADTKKPEADKKTETKVTPKVIQHSPQQLVAVIGKEEQKLSTLPTVRIECPRCGNNTAYVWQVQTRGADESSTQFLRCTKCNYTYREYS